MSDLYIGSMSGTSCDGIDTVLVDFSGQMPSVLAHTHCAYPENIKNSLDTLISTQHANLEMLGALGTQLGELYGLQALEVLKLAQVQASIVQAMGLHGQTIYHAPQHSHPFTWQLGNAHVVAVMTQIPVIADFRGLDIALQGQGAPLAPVFHAALFGRLHERVAVLNLGGIANVSLIQDGQVLQAFDTGPANCLLDAWMMQVRQQAYDAEGDFARQGQVIPELLARLLKAPYFQQKPPKSTGREHFNLSWVASYLQPEYLPEDVAATLTELTAVSIQEALQQSQFMPQALIICGGGNKNLYLRERISQLLSCPLSSSEDYAFDVMQIEALAFAYLAKMFMENKYLYLNKMTGSARAHRCGVLYNFI